MTRAAGAALLWCPFPDMAAARQAATALLEERLIACANILPQARSLFLWQGQIEEADEAVMLAKTRADRLERAVARLEALHPYATPAISGWHAEAAPAAMRAWLTEALDSAEGGRA